MCRSKAVALTFAMLGALTGELRRKRCVYLRVRSHRLAAPEWEEAFARSFKKPSRRINSGEPAVRDRVNVKSAHDWRESANVIAVGIKAHCKLACFSRSRSRHLLSDRAVQNCAGPTASARALHRGPVVCRRGVGNRG